MAGYKKKTGMYNGRLEDGVVSGDGVLQVALYSHGLLYVALLTRNSTLPQDHCRALGIVLL